jgi:urease accessory protein
MVEPSTSSDTFAANRARGHVAVTVHAANGISRRTRVQEDGSLRVRFPNGDGRDLDAVLVNTAGGIAGGDRFDLSFDVATGASLTVTTAAAEKTYRTHGPDSTIALRLTVADGATLRWLPQETILFDRARLARTVDIDLAPEARLLLAEAVVFGRSAMGETVEQGAFLDRWRVRRSGRLVFAETMQFDGAIAGMLAKPAVAAGGIAFATVLIAPGEGGAVDAVRALEGVAGEVGISCWNGLAVARLCATDGAALRHDLMMVLSAVSPGAPPRLWLN